VSTIDVIAPPKVFGFSIIESGAGQNIRDLADVSTVSDGHYGLMQIQISLDSDHPLTGAVATDGSAPMRFVGWLDLIRVLAEIVERPRGQPAGRPPRRAASSRRAQAS